jgi:hypothetical protein
VSILNVTVTLQVTCITKRGGHQNPHERILVIGSLDSARRWWDAEDTAIRNIDTQRARYYANVGGHAVNVVIAEHLGRKYLKTQADGYAPNNLLSFPECPCLRSKRCALEFHG